MMRRVNVNSIVKGNRGWKLDRPALITQIVVLLIVSIIAWVGNYYGTKYTVIDHDKRISTNEKIIGEHGSRIVGVETYVAQDRIQTKWFEEKFMYIGKRLDEIRDDQRRRHKNEK
jgi:hypothetical protein